MSVVRRLTDEETVPVMEAAGLEPLEPYPGADVPWRCRCRSCGSDVAPRYNGVRQGRGCQVCGKARSAVDVMYDTEKQKAVFLHVIRDEDTAEFVGAVQTTMYVEFDGPPSNRTCAVSMNFASTYKQPWK